MITNEASPAEWDRMRVVLHAPAWSRWFALGLIWAGIEFARRLPTPGALAGWALMIAGAIVFARSHGHSVLVLDRASNSFAQYSKGGLTFVGDFDVDLSDCSGAQLCTLGPVEWIEVHHRDGSRVIWRAPRGGADREAVRALQQFLGRHEEHPELA